jgi:hypothetical protein
MQRLQVIQCPYCVDNDEFNVMTPRAGGHWFLCSYCAHVVIPDQPGYQCSCSKCMELSRPLSSDSN